MCGRFNFSDEQLEEIKEIIRETNERLYGQKVKTGEVYPTDLAAVMVYENSKVTPVGVNWGFPKWKGKGVIINARAETAAQKPMFKESLRSRRCAVPSTGFYEWRRVNGHVNEHERQFMCSSTRLRSKSVSKEKYLLTEPGKDILYMAGIIDVFTKPDGVKYNAFTILTTKANDSVSPLHDRMPVILQRGEIEAWLRDGEFTQTVLERTCPPLITTLVNELAEKEYTQTSLF